jgi:hypothetical protein
MDVWNVGILSQHYTASQPRRLDLKHHRHERLSFLLQCLNCKNVSTGVSVETNINWERRKDMRITYKWMPFPHSELHAEMLKIKYWHDTIYRKYIHNKYRTLSTHKASGVTAYLHEYYCLPHSMMDMQRDHEKKLETFSARDNSIPCLNVQCYNSCIIFSARSHNLKNAVQSRLLSTSPSLAVCTPYDKLTESGCTRPQNETK